MQPQAQQNHANGAGGGNTHTATSTAASSKYSLKNRQIASCLTCRARKVKCDKARPSCSQCRRRQRPCTYVDSERQKEKDESAQNSVQLSLKDRVRRLESFVTLALADPNRLLSEVTAGPDRKHKERNHEVIPTSPTSKIGSLSLSDVGEQNTPSSNADSEGHTTSPDPKFRGALLLEDGKAQFFSPVHWTMMGEELQGLKDLLGDDLEHDDASSMSEESVISPWRGTDDMDDDQRSLSYLAFRHGSSSKTVSLCYPETANDCSVLLEAFINNVDPMVRIIHRPTLRKQFCDFVKSKYTLDDSGHTEAPKSFEPLFFAVAFSAIHSMTDSEIATDFQPQKDVLIQRYQRGLEISLAREDFMVSQKIEVMQAFILLITCISREDDISRSWAMTGLAIRIAQGMGLHRDPLNFPSGAMDQVQVETRRRIWHQICHLDLRTSEAQGHEPFITDDFYDTKFPRNVNDDDVICGLPPDPDDLETEEFTDITLSLIKFHAMATFRKLLHMTFGKGRIPFGGSGGDGMEPLLAETCCGGPKTEQELGIEVSALFDEMSATNKKYVRFCDPSVFEQRFTAGLVQVMESKFWVVFYHRYSRSYREENWTMDFRRKILEISASCIFSVKSALIEEDTRFQWHVNSYVGLHAAVHILSELCSSSFQTDEDSALRERCWEAIDYLKMKNANRTSKPWTMMRNMINAAEQRHRSQQPPHDIIIADLINGNIINNNNINNINNNVINTTASNKSMLPIKMEFDQKADFLPNQLGDFTNILPVDDQMPIYTGVSIPQDQVFDWEQWDLAYNDVLRGLPVI